MPNYTEPEKPDVTYIEPGGGWFRAGWFSSSWFRKGKGVVTYTEPEKPTSTYTEPSKGS